MRNIVIYNKNNPNSYRKVIDFKTVEELDNYTRKYDTEIDLLSDIMNKIDKEKMIEIRNYIKSNSGNIKLGLITNMKRYNKIIPIMYKNDYYDNIDLMEKFKEYFFNNQNDVIKNWHIGIEKVFFYQDGVRRQVKYKKNNLKIGDISNIINSYLEGSNYKKYRDIYFNLKSRGISSKKIKDKDERDKRNIFYVEDDDYARYLQSYSNLGEEECDKAIDDFMMMYMPEDNYKKR